MGSRGNVYLTNSISEAYDFGSRGVYLYSHWDGHELPDMVRQALEFGRGRWGDNLYLMRIIVDQVTGPGRDQEIGYGLGLEMGDNSFPITVVDLGKQEVAWAYAGNERDRSRWVDAMPFADVVNHLVLNYPEALFED